MKKAVFLCVLFMLGVTVYAGQLSKEEKDRIEEQHRKWKTIDTIVSEINVPNDVARREYIRHIVEYYNDYEYGHIESNKAKM